MTIYRVWVLYQQKYRKFRGVTQSACTLGVYRSMQPECKVKTTGTVLKPINFYVDTIFILPDLRTDHRMSTKLGDQKMAKKFA